MKDLDFSKIGLKIKDIRTSKKLTQEYLANATDVNVSHISNIETNKVKVSLTLLVHICNALDTTIDYILENEYTSPDSPIEKELLYSLSKMDNSKKQQLLRIANVL